LGEDEALARGQACGWSPPLGDHGLLLVGTIESGGLRFRARVDFAFAPGEKEHVEED
jgi:hypothetical protein